MLGPSLGTVLSYLNSHLAARTVALAWGQAAPDGAVAVTSIAGTAAPGDGDRAVVADHDDPHVRDPDDGHAPGAPGPGTNLPTVLRIQVGPITWDLGDAAAYTSLLNA